MIQKGTYFVMLKYRTHNLCACRDPSSSKQLSNGFDTICCTYFIFVFVIYLSQDLSLCSPSWPGTYYVDKAGPELQRSTSLCL